MVFLRGSRGRVEEGGGGSDMRWRGCSIIKRVILRETCLEATGCIGREGEAVAVWGVQGIHGRFGRGDGVVSPSRSPRRWTL